MDPIVLVRADASETFGVGPSALADAGAEVVVWEAIRGEPRPTLDAIGGIIVGGSTFNIEHAGDQPFIVAMRDVTREAVDRATPFLGLCFGSQLLAWSLGASVYKAPEREFGYTPLHPTASAAEDPVLGHYAEGDMVFQWHMDTFDLPAGAALLATGDAVAHQAIRVGDAAWATQFHLEVDRGELDAWVAEVADIVERDWGKTPAQIAAEAGMHQAAHEARGAEVFRRFAKVVQERA